MTKTDWTPEGQPPDAADPLSATGMFLSALGKESSQAQKPPEASAAPSAATPEAKPTPWTAEPAFSPSAFSSPAAPATGSSQGAPGEFTKMFHTTESPAAPLAPVYKAPIPVAPPPASDSAPGEFTRIFVKSGDPVPAPPARQAFEPHVAPATPPASRLKGFSSGASDSASAEGSFTSFFQSPVSTPVPPPAPRVQTYSPPPSSATPAEEFKWSRQPEFKSSESPAASGSSPSSVTGLIASLASTGERPAVTRSQSVEPLPSFSTSPSTPIARPSEPATPEAGSVTRLIQRLAETPRVAPVAEAPPAAAVPVPPASFDSGPGEFTRMISANPARPAASAPAPPVAAPAAAAPAFSPPAFAVPVAKPAIAMPPPPPMPAAALPPMPAPQIAMPPVAIPKPAPPAVAAPAGKFQEMVPILLVVNTFLLLVLIVLVIFALRGK